MRSPSPPHRTNLGKSVSRLEIRMQVKSKVKVVFLKVRLVQITHFCQILPQFSSFPLLFQLFDTKTEKAYFNQHLECAAPKHRSKYSKPIILPWEYLGDIKLAHRFCVLRHRRYGKMQIWHSGFDARN